MPRVDLYHCSRAICSLYTVTHVFLYSEYPNQLVIVTNSNGNACPDCSVVPHIAMFELIAYYGTAS